MAEEAVADVTNFFYQPKNYEKTILTIATFGSKPIFFPN